MTKYIYMHLYKDLYTLRGGYMLKFLKVFFFCIR